MYHHDTDTIRQSLARQTIIAVCVVFVLSIIIFAGLIAAHLASESNSLGGTTMSDRTLSDTQRHAKYESDYESLVIQGKLHNDPMARSNYISRRWGFYHQHQSPEALQEKAEMNAMDDAFWDDIEPVEPAERMDRIVVSHIEDWDENSASRPAAERCRRIMNA